MEGDILNSMFLGNTIRNYLLCGIILFVGLLFRRFFSRLLSRILYKMLGSVHAGADSNIFVGLLLKPVEMLILVVTVFLAVNQLDFPLQEIIFRRTRIIDNVPAVYEIKLVRVIDKLFLLLFIISIFRIILRIIDFIAHIYLLKASNTELRSDDQIVPFLKELSKILTIIVAVFVILGSVFSMNVATIIAGLGIGGIAVALAAQDTLQNLLGSFTIFADKPFIVGDHVRIDKYEGTVEKVGFRSTLIRTLDKTMVSIPNKKMVDSPLENLSRRESFRVLFNIRLKYGISPELMRKISGDIEQAVNGHPLLKDARITFENFGESDLTIQVLYYVPVAVGTDFAMIHEEVNYKIMEIVKENGADFAFPSQTVYHEYKEGEAP